MSTGKHALVFGASGMFGWGVVNEILKGYPSKTTFSRVSALTNRPLSREASQWPEDPRLYTASGIDLLKGSQQDLETILTEQIPEIETVTQFFFFCEQSCFQRPGGELTSSVAYKFCDERIEESKINTDMIDRCVRAIEKLSPALEHVILPSGTKVAILNFSTLTYALMITQAYGVHIMPFPNANNLPLKESHPRISEPDRSELFYYHQHDTLNALSERKSWNWSNVRPDVIIGFVPNNNTYCIVQSMGVYLSLYAYVEGKGAKVAFPGTAKSYRNLSNDSSQDIVARFSIHTALGGQSTNRRTFNVADNRLPTPWAYRWPVICEFFGLKGTGPEEDSPQPGLYIAKHKEQWQEMVKKYGLKDGHLENNITSPVFLDFCTTIMDFDRQLDLSEQRSTGFTEETDTKDAWWTALEKFRTAKVIA
jgi:hypothetical protein